MVAGRLDIKVAVTRNPCIIQVTNRNGRPLAEARIAVEQADGPVPELMYVTDDEGKVQIGLPPGRILLRIFPQGGKSSSAEIEVSDEPARTYNVRTDTP
jgi:hypothetical protein